MRTEYIDPPVYRVLDPALTACSPGAAKPDPVDMITLSSALAEEKTAGDICRAKVAEIRALDG